MTLEMQVVEDKCDRFIPVNVIITPPVLIIECPTAMQMLKFRKTCTGSPQSNRLRFLKYEWEYLI
jgi:hypothetical protein